MVKLNGKLSHMFVDIPYKKEDIIGKPIRGFNGENIGIVTGVDIDNNMWIGETYDEFDYIFNTHMPTSVEIKNFDR